MHYLHLLSEGESAAGLAWILYILGGLFLLAIVFGWMTMPKEQNQVSVKKEAREIPASSPKPKPASKSLKKKSAPKKRPANKKV